ncbi:UDP-N-acetylglucosamine--N-acetylmuramyl-(pentapeptide) pyrophosphoryl-undecaprenol N-acetylglucosamine transferase [Candidatus Hydrogenisulfobacillus filiaventi]|uniref:UDP-N-acetylglucosamine--N-acetylmuramyl-(pentapeptide) pyrophosphoryl-undecaprenol N-acetylglucosamine transferase n=1 Tax=Candidatus Hydrogenisulfobacillus filiaventi TaxID=2707344 RepID=A0A6F8ZEP1_9FIRM|nr:undecaprenyldiphospho-muramoylpentapeptide beta-N-acetylglucosaminyltransferase [Bacillota bacterium]CAB1128466.1 UDP-N-acetylglucosamine--N-acetylmuramyl-(pentapeptide) pyrophosphoryl-undecaprenol N-acetylglucosamine transferase [Candidatus Hydrogenisulfobacillus filiaventi]
MRLVVSGGGTGGHIYPALAIAAAVRRACPSCEVFYVGTDRGLERELAAREQVPYYAVHARGLLGRGLGGKIRGGLAAVRALGEAWRLLRRLRPQAVVGTGGYVTGPVGLAAAWLHIPLLLQEQNVYPGWTNRVLARRARLVVIPFPEVRRYLPPGTPTLVAGNPVRAQRSRSPAEAKAALGLDPQSRVLLITGGSQGAAAINRLARTLAERWGRYPGWHLYWAYGSRYPAPYPDGQAPAGVHPAPYFYDLPRLYEAADLFIGRAGAMTVSECLAFGLAAVLVPSPNVAEDHQTRNAALLADKGAALLLPETRLDQPEALTAVEELIADEARRAAMAERAHALYRPGSAEAIAAAVLAAMRGRGGLRDPQAAGAGRS